MIFLHVNRIRRSLVFSLASVTICIALGSPTSTSAQTRNTPSKDPAAHETQWNTFRGPGGLGISPSKGLPTKWSKSEGIAWKVSLPGPGASSPIVFNNHIYLTCYSGFFVPGDESGQQENLVRHLLCFDSKSGTLLWEKKIPAKLPEEERIRDHGFAANSPAADTQGVVCFFGKSGVIAFDHSGNEAWRADVGSNTHGWGSSASPVFFEDLVFINASVESQSLIALDRKTGQERWRAAGIRESWNTPILAYSTDNSAELVLAIQGKILAFEPKTGKPIWNCDTDITWYMVPGLIAHDHTIYCLGGRSGISSLAVQTGGTGDVTKSKRLWTSTKGSNVSSPVYHNGHLFWMNDNSGIAYCAKATTGEVVYEHRLNRPGQVYASAFLADDKIYYLTRDGRTFVVEAIPQFKQVEVNDLSDGGVFNGSFAVDGKRLLVRSDKYLYAIEN